MEHNKSSGKYMHTNRVMTLFVFAQTAYGKVLRPNTKRRGI